MDTSGGYGHHRDMAWGASLCGAECRIHKLLKKCVRLVVGLDV